MDEARVAEVLGEITEMKIALNNISNEIKHLTKIEEKLENTGNKTNESLLMIKEQLNNLRIENKQKLDEIKNLLRYILILVGVLLGVLVSGGAELVKMLVGGLA